MRISGVMPLRNAIKLGYPFKLAIRSLHPLCDEVVVLVDPTSEDDTLACVRSIANEFSNFTVVESAWDTQNHKGYGNSEVAKQTAIACATATGDWILSLQADEVLHEKETAATRAACEEASRDGYSALAMVRVYFFGGLDKYRDNWTVPCLRLFEREKWTPDRFSGGMQFVPISQDERSRQITPRIYHYSRVGDPASVAQRVRNLDTFYHDPSVVAETGSVGDYTFALRKLDTYVLGHAPESDDEARLLPFDLREHPAGILTHFGVTS